MLKPGQKVPSLDLPLTIGAQYDLAKQNPENFKIVVFYRGKHCPICKNYLKQWGEQLGEFTERGINVVAVSMDSEGRAMVVDKEWDTGDVPLAYGMTEDKAREWGLYISQKREGSEEPETFSEPGLFVIRPDGELYFACTQNAPFTRPPIDELLSGLDYIMENDYPTRGTLT